MKRRSLLVVVPRLLSAGVLLLLLSSRAHAAPIALEFTFDHFTPIVSPEQIGLSFTFFESPTNGWPGAFPPQPYLAQGGTSLVPGWTQVDVSLNTDNLNDVYFTLHGSYFLGDGSVGLFVAAPPSGPVPGELAFGYGPPWIPLQNIGSGFGGELEFFFGQSIGDLGTWELTPETPVPVPEPASFLLLGSGIAALAANKYRRLRGAKRER